MTQPPPPSGSRGYPLAALFIVLAAAAILSGLISPVISLIQDNRISVADPALSAGALGCFLLLLTASITGLVTGRREGYVIGAGVGFVIGATAGIILWIPPESFGSAALKTTLGSALMLAAAAVGRRR